MVDTSPSGATPQPGGRPEHSTAWDWIFNAAFSLHYGEEPLAEFDGLTADEIDRMRSTVDAITKACGILDRHLLAAMREHLGERGYVRYGPTVYRAGRDRSWKIRRDRENELWNWIDTTPRAARELFNPNQARATGLRALSAVLADRGWCNPETGELGWQAFEDWFLEVTDSGPVVQVLPASRAPLFIQNTDSGEVVKK